MAGLKELFIAQGLLGLVLLKKGYYIYWEEVLKAAPAQDVVAAIENDGFDFSPYTDDEGFFTRGWGEAGAGAPEWCDALLIGDAEFDVLLLSPFLLIPHEN